jgi:MIP family channel proteins
VTNNTPLSTALSAEFLGTFMLVFACAGAAALGAGGLVGVALAQGLALTVAVYLFGHLSGAHVNPAVTVGVWLAGRINTRRALSYVVFQVFGAVVAALALRFVLGGIVGNLGGTALGGELEVGDATILVTPAAGLVVESLLTLFLVLAVLQGAIAGRAGHMAGVVIGAALAVGVLVGGPLTGASLNPARTLGPALVTGDFADLWIYLAGPISGGALAALLFRNALGR